ncbi:4Fe-4S binding protein [Desulfovibrio aerotolerans]|uniref:4Fe-4S binding protein n=1 Tax=Solidesulfovibrio aerotolerans TaxID=295255 RepID=A0A7C9MJC2_9BACT|nr:4Fe-4S binding protein [Solidesulfovibrio aerotolerans]MYL83828.1 4Fe-4S binding protein [Solidesulfovibrio aerotolerans]
MGIVTARRLSQGFFLLVFCWLCLVTTLGDGAFELRGWPVNWLLSLAPLTALATGLATGSLFAPLLWAVPVVIASLFLGRFFCGFACPLGTLNQLSGYLTRKTLGRAGRAEDNHPSPAQGLKYALLAFLLAAAVLGNVQTGLLDPLALLTRSASLAVLPLLDPRQGLGQAEARHYDGAWVVGLLLVAILALNALRPRFFCRYLCPLGAFFGLLTRFSPWRIGKADTGNCGTCRLCEEYCEGGCRPSGQLIVSECVLCLNCLDRCPTGRIGFAGRPSAAGEQPLPDFSRRGAVLVLASGTAGLLAAPLWSVGGVAGIGRNPGLIRPPGSLDEARFLARCIRCGQCMRVCPANVIQPAVTVAGAAGLWTPALDYRLGRAGCLPNCIACGQVCPTAAIRPLSIEEKRGLGDFAAAGPLRLGTAFVDRSRCLPWAMGRPCLVCQEVCPVSPKAITVREVFEPLRLPRLAVADSRGTVVTLAALPAVGRNLAAGDFFLRPAGLPQATPQRILGRAAAQLTLAAPLAEAAPGREVEIVVRLEQPHVDPAQCIGCGMCEHECPVSGLRAIRVTSENESRSGPGRMLAEAARQGGRSWRRKSFPA